MRTQEVQCGGYSFTITWVHSGQYRPYGDSFYVAEVKTSCPSESIVAQALRLIDSSMPRYPKKMWDVITRDASIYFDGWFTLEKTAYGWKYTECKPYTD